MKSWFISYFCSAKHVTKTNTNLQVSSFVLPSETAAASSSKQLFAIVSLQGRVQYSVYKLANAELSSAR